MTFNPTTPHSFDALSLNELDLYHQIMAYRAEAGLAPIPMSKGLTTTAGRHSADTLYNIWDAEMVLPDGTNLHSWSDAPYFSDHSEPQIMWGAPTRINSGYNHTGYEISAAGYPTIEAALEGWKNSPGHDAVVVNSGIWASSDWAAIGIGVAYDPDVSTYGGYVYHVWFGTDPDPNGGPKFNGTSQSDQITGTMFHDDIAGHGGSDQLIGKAGRDTIHGNQGRDFLSGGGGNDKIYGGGGNDKLLGQNAKDILNGGKGFDILKGGQGQDTFVFAKIWGRDRIADFDGDIIRIKSNGEASTETELAQALTNVDGRAVYDHLGDGQNVIIFTNLLVADLDFSAFDLG
jgi:uncharacterized protein YkwD